MTGAIVNLICHLTVSHCDDSRRIPRTSVVGVCQAKTSHATSATTYGVGTTSNYGHVKISNGDVASVAHANGLVAGMDHSHSNYTTDAEFTGYTGTTKTTLEGLRTDVDNKALKSDLTAHTSNSTIHITSSDKTKWNKVDNKLDNSVFTGYTGTTKTTLEGLRTDVDNKALKSDLTTLSDTVGTLRNNFDTLVSGNTDTVIESFKEVTAFLSGVTDTQSLDGILAGIGTSIDSKISKPSSTVGNSTTPVYITSAGTITKCTAYSKANVSSATKVTITADATDSNQNLIFVSATGNNVSLKSDSNLTYNPSSNTLNVGTLTGSTVKGSTVQGTTISGTNVYGATNVTGATVSGTNVKGTTVSGTNVYGATSVTGATVSGTNVKGTTVSGTNVIGATSVKGATVSGTNVYSSAFQTKNGNYLTDIYQSDSYLEFISNHSSANIRLGGEDNGDEFNIIPGTDNCCDLGSNDYRFKNLHAHNIYENGTLLSNKYTTYSYIDGIGDELELKLTKPSATVGSATQPVYITSGGSICACTAYSGASVSSATYATNATKVYMTSDSSNTTHYLAFTSGNTTGYKALRYDSNLYYNPSSNTLTISSGKISASTITASTSMYSAAFYETSDERLKNFQDKIPVDLDKLSKLKKNYFTWKEKERGEKLEIGVSAQEIKELYPEIVSDEGETLSVAYDKLSVVALSAVDVLYEENKSLKNKVSELEEQIKNINEFIKTLKKNKYDLI